MQLKRALVCAVFGTSIAGLLAAFLVEAEAVTALVQVAVFAWMMAGVKCLRECGWRASYGRDNAVWIIKDSLAILMWPILHRWIARRAETE